MSERESERERERENERDRQKERMRERAIKNCKIFLLSTAFARENSVQIR